MLKAKSNFQSFKEVIKFVSWREGSLTDITKDIAKTPIEPWHGGCLLGICFLEGEETIFYQTAKTERIISFLPSKKEIVCLNMDSSIYLKSDIEEIAGTLVHQKRDYLWIPIMVIKRILSDECGEFCSPWARLEWSMQDFEKIEENNQQVITKIYQIEKSLERRC